MAELHLEELIWQGKGQEGRHGCTHLWRQHREMEAELGFRISLGYIEFEANQDCMENKTR